ncbi:MAG: DUF1549 domain-containing protein [Planctomycetaceae bacterium]
MASSLREVPAWSIRALRFLAAALLISALANTDAMLAAETKEPSAKPEGAKVEFATQIQPIFAKRCAGCHGPEKQESDLRLDLGSAAKKGGAGGAVIVVGKSGESSLLHRITSTEKEEMMPPEGERLSKAEIELIRNWIDQGAGWPDQVDPKAALEAARAHWSFQPPVRKSPPQVKNNDWVQSPIDAFVLETLEQKNFAPSSEAERRTLIRRLSLDLLGLTPSPEEIAEFENDPAPDAYEKLVDRLLDNPHFGERWGRHWLDLARYADSDGYEKDNFRPHAWRYRDWVIGAINADLPFDQFTTEQIAGDLLPNRTAEQLVATGLHRQTLINTEGGVDQEEFRIKAVVDRVNTTGTVWLGLSVGCAECHSHKYDPISQTEFYQLFAFYNNADEADYNYPASGPEAEKFQAALAKHQESVAKIKADIAQAEKEGADPSGKIKQLINSLMRLERDAPKSPTGAAMIFTERDKPRKTNVLLRGDFQRPGAEVQPASLNVLHAFSKPSDRQPNRLDLAKWLVDESNPLTARVFVNRTWMHLFGRGLVATPDDFGKMGEKPSHPALLDWLATEFHRLGGSRKQLIRTIVNSSTYRQSSQPRPDLESVDPYNTLLARQTRFRVEAEIVRDLCLESGGLLAEQLGGKSIRPPLPPSVAEVSYASSIKWTVSEGTDRHRRGLYIAFQRTIPYPSLMAFDCPDGVVTSVSRSRSNTPLQALTILNDPVFFECAQAMGKRLLEARAENDAERLDLAGRIALSRSWNENERLRLLDLLEQQRASFKLDPRAAREHAGSALVPIDQLTEDEAAVETASWISVASALMNLDEFLTRE